MKKGYTGYTLIELLVTLAILGIVLSFITMVIVGGSSGGDLITWFYPEIAKARAQQEMAEEMRRSNDLRERELKEK